MKKPIKRLVILGCVHSGSRHASLSDFKRWVDLAEDEDTYLLSLGDLFENAIPARGEGMVWDQTATPDDQIDDVERILRPVRHKIVGACTSNHSRRTYKEVGIDMDRQLFKRLGISHVYHGLQGVVTFAGKKLAFAHGNGSGDNWNDAKKLFAIYPVVDIVATSHRHEMQSKWYGNYRIDHRGYKSRRHILFVRTGSLMDWASYAQAELYTPQKPGFTVLYFPPDGTVRVDTNGVP